jgi:hypothetical protein
MLYYYPELDYIYENITNRCNTHNEKISGSDQKYYTYMPRLIRYYAKKVSKINKKYTQSIDNLSNNMDNLQIEATVNELLVECKDKSAKLGKIIKNLNADTIENLFNNFSDNENVGTDTESTNDDTLEDLELSDTESTNNDSTVESPNNYNSYDIEYLSRVNIKCRNNDLNIKFETIKSLIVKL